MEVYFALQFIEYYNGNGWMYTLHYNLSSITMVMGGSILCIIIYRVLQWQWVEVYFASQFIEYYNGNGWKYTLHHNLSSITMVMGGCILSITIYRVLQW